MAKNKPKRHHFLPEFYLKKFVDKDNLFWVFDREKKTYEHKGPRGTGWKPHYYTYQGKDGQKHTDIEQELLNNIETETKPVIDKIERGDTLTQRDEEVIATFVAFQHTRVPEYEKTTNEIAEKIVKEINRRTYPTKEKTKERLIKAGLWEKESDSDVYDLIQKDEYSVKVAREYSLSNMLKITEHIIPALMVYKWIFFFAPPTTSFITTDNHFYLVPPENRNPNDFWERGVGILTPGAKKIIPLSSRVCLGMTEPQRNREIIGTKIDREGVRKLNILAIANSDKLIIAKDLSHLQHLIKITKADSWLKKDRIVML